ncbi:SWIM zinc finger family protein [Propioniciclava coleopterorum]|uniref:SWIM zinc finger family protein n=1 Tax=Propioniciclava coleopterorum TaxID=2714937 RepID=A0A6G7Y7J2_9ACTN|nr:SWIM zinc finger family protein [Propioniciclava coleopterorum]QIK72785.1 SWIM zinc finger family protein [Propioniciclava coleopterorum]
MTATYRYLWPSELDGDALTLATSGGSDADGPAEHPHFFSGFVARPDVVAAGLLALARVARTRFYVPPNAQAAVLRAADPVVTSTPEGLRLESFSACCGVYARLDVAASALDAERVAAGVTNVDVNPPLRQALAGLRAREPLHLDVGTDGLRATTLDGAVVEERVPLPTRWLKGFAETQALSAGMALRHELDADAARAFVRGLPRSSTTRTVLWATRASRGLRLASRPTAGAVAVAGPERLRVLEPILRHATGLRAFAPDVSAGSPPSASGWVLGLPGATLTIGLSPEKTRGFSGEGAVLSALAGPHTEHDADLVSALLAFDPRIDPAKLGAGSGLPAERVAGALALLATSGQVGYDLDAGAWFHRPLPYLPTALTALHPRLADAHALAEAGAVEVTDGIALVRSGAATHEVRLADDRCTCPWYAQYRGTRGPCKHVLVAHLAAEAP